MSRFSFECFKKFAESTIGLALCYLDFSIMLENWQNVMDEQNFLLSEFVFISEGCSIMQ